MRFLESVLWFTVVTVGLCFAENVEFIPAKTQFEITSGSSIGAVDRVLYTEEDSIMFTIPPLPRLFDLTGQYCMYEKSACDVINSTMILNAATIELHQALLRMFSITGQKSVPFNVSNLFNQSLDSEDQEMKELKSIVGSDMYQQILKVANNKSMTARQKRASVLPMLARAGISAAPRLAEVMKNLFNSKKVILSALARTKLTVPRKFSSFLKFPKTQTQLAALEDEQTALIQQQSQGILHLDYSKYRKNGQSDVYPAAQLNTLIYVLSKLQYDSAYLVHQSILYSVHAQALSACRANEIPITFISPEQVMQKLAELQNQIPEDLELVWGPEQHMKYFKSDSAHCSFYEDGGIVTISVPLRPKKSKFALYRFQGISFRKHNQTCDLELPSLYMIKDFATDTIYPITDLDEDLCAPNTQDKCKVPAISAADTPQHMCVRAILTEAPVSVLKKVCQMNCKDDITTLPVQVSDSTIVVTKLPGTGASVACGSNRYSLNHSIETGALQVTLGCGCKLVLEGRALAQSLAKTCERDFVPYQLLGLLPAQWTNLEHWKAQPHDRSIDKGFRFDSIAEILRIIDPVLGGTAADWILAQVNKTSLITTSGQLIQAAVTGYFIYRVRSLEATVAVLSAKINAVNAEYNNNTCEIPVHLEIVAYLTLLLLMIFVLPKVIRPVINCFKEKWLTAVQNEANRQAENRQV